MHNWKVEQVPVELLVFFYKKKKSGNSEQRAKEILGRSSQKNQIVWGMLWATHYKKNKSTEIGYKIALYGDITNDSM